MTFQRRRDMPQYARDFAASIIAEGRIVGSDFEFEHARPLHL
jgi:hypothetical protein